MISDSPHVYQRSGLVAGRPAQLLEAAVDQAALVEKRGLTSVLTLMHLAHQTGASYNYLRSIVERQIDPYADLVRRRGNGRKMRAISSPDTVLMAVQRWILRHVLDPLPVHPASAAYLAGSSIRKCAARHAGAEWLVKLDIRNFFETIDERRVYKVFERSGYQPLPALELARICTRYAGHASHVDSSRFTADGQYEVIKAYRKPLMGFLPQGAPTSGAIANQVAHALDRRLDGLARERSLAYTRYADDMVFSSVQPFRRADAVDLIHAAMVEIRRQHFEVHPRKTSVVPPGARKIVLGLLVDREQPRLTRMTRGRIEHHVRGVEVFGLAAHVAHIRFSSIEGLVRHVGGLIAFASDVEPEWASPIEMRWRIALRKDLWRSHSE